MSEQEATKPGKQTSEAKMNWVAIITAIVLPALHFVLSAVLEHGLVQNSIMVTALGTVVALLASMGYTASRTIVKTNAMKLEATKAIAANPPRPAPGPQQ
jgi:tRNA G26 N,N-dimethylase Trm1